jgi:hypothetical protein
MASEERGNGQVGQESTTNGLSEVNLSSSEQTHRDERGNQLSLADDQLEFFGGGRGEGGNESGSGGESPDFFNGPGGRDSNSPHGAFVTISPPLSPGKLLLVLGDILRKKKRTFWC